MRCRVSGVLLVAALLCLSADTFASILVYRYLRVGREEEYSASDSYISTSTVRVRGYLVFEYIPDLKDYNNAILIEYWEGRGAKTMMRSFFMGGNPTFREISFNGKPALLISGLNLDAMSPYHNAGFMFGLMNPVKAAKIGMADDETLMLTATGSAIWDENPVGDANFAGSGAVSLNLDYPFTSTSNASGLSVDEAVADIMNYLSGQGYKDVSPIATPENVATTINTPLSIDVLANDMDPQGLPIEISGIHSYPAHGDANIVQDESLKRPVVQYVPQKGWTGTDTFIYQIANSSGGTAKAMVTVTVVIP